MNVDFTKAFNKQFKKLPRKSQERAKAAVTLFLEDMAHPILRNHALKGGLATIVLAQVATSAYISK